MNLGLPTREQFIDEAVRRALSAYPVIPVKLTLRSGKYARREPLTIIEAHFPAGFIALVRANFKMLTNGGFWCGIDFAMEEAR